MANSDISPGIKSSIELRDVYDTPSSSADLLYALLAERTAQQSIHHKGLPSYDDHCRFQRSKPYRAWYLIVCDEEAVGAISLTTRQEVGVFIFEKYQRRGYGKRALQLLREKHPGKVTANINPNNRRSANFFKAQGFKLIQHTYEG